MLAEQKLRKITAPSQEFLFPEMERDSRFEAAQTDVSSTFADNMRLPIHRWYRYTAGFSAEWVGELLERETARGHVNVIDPFAGSGTVLVEGLRHNVSAVGLEANPYVYRIARAKLSWANLETDAIRACAGRLVSDAEHGGGELEGYPELVRRCFRDDVLAKLDLLKKSVLQIGDETMRNFAWFLVTSILRSTSHVGTAQWQYIQPRKSKAKVADPLRALEEKVVEVLSDIAAMRPKIRQSATAQVIFEDSREVHSIPPGWGDLVITSPPYANNYDYADAMRLEMLFWGDAATWDDIQQKVTPKLVRACTQHVAALKESAERLLESPLLAPIGREIAEKFSSLAAERAEHGGKKNYHLMVAAYFYDLARVFESLSRVTKDKCKVCFVIGDSAPYGIYIPVDEWLGRLAIASGFRDFHFEKTRDRNVKWKNRKHRVPLKEGRLWISK